MEYAKKSTNCKVHITKWGISIVMCENFCIFAVNLKRKGKTMSNNEQRIRTAIEKLKGLGFDKYTLPFNEKVVENMFPMNEVLDHFTFSGMSTLVWAVTKDKNNGEYYYYDTYKSMPSRKVFTEEMLGIVADELERQYNSVSNIVDELQNCDEDLVMDKALELVVKPYMAEQLKVWQNVSFNERKKYRIEHYSSKPIVTMGKRQCDEPCKSYKALVIGEGYGYIGGMVFSKDHMKYFAPCAGETRYTFDPKHIVANIQSAVRWICQ